MAEFGVRMTGDNSEYRSMLTDSVKQGESFAGQIAGKVTDKLVGLRDVSHTIATTLGLNLEAVAEKIARVYTSLSKAEEEGFKSLAEISTQAADLAIKNMRATLTEEQKYQLALQERDRLQRLVNDGASSGGADQARLAKLNLELQQRTSEVLAFEQKQQGDIAKADEARAKASDDLLQRKRTENEREVRAQNDLLDGEAKLAAMKDNILLLEGFITAERNKGKDVTDLEFKLASDRRDLAKVAATEQERADKEALDIEERMHAEYLKTHDVKKAIIADGVEQVAVEQAVTAEIEAQNAALEEQNHQRSMIVTNTYGSADKDLSDRELSEKSYNLKKQLQAAQLANDTGAFFFQQKLNEVNFEIGRRSSFRSDYAQKGDKAFLDFSAFDEQTLRSYIRPEDQRLATQAQQATIELNQRLAASGMFPLRGSAPIG